jgi:transposase InsO family protein
MKLGEQFTHIDHAFASLMASLQAIDSEGPLSSDRAVGRRVRRDLPLQRRFSSVPRIIPQHLNPCSSSTTDNKLHLLQIAAFEATYADNKTPISPDCFPLIIDTGASISVTPYRTDFISDIHPVQSLEIQGIASGLTVKGAGTVTYSYYNDAGALQTITLKHCLYVPQCTARLLCPRQLGIQSGLPHDGFNATTQQGVLTFQGHPTTIQYDPTTQLPILYTAPGHTSFTRFCAHQSYLTKHPYQLPDCNKPTQYMYSNLTAAQQKKLHLHERCAHAGWDQLNIWIRQGILPCDPALAKEPDPVCAACQFGKAHKRSHLANVGSISQNHTAPGDGVSTDGMEAGIPGRVFSTSGLPSSRRYRYATFWIDHYSRYVHITMHETKKAEELLRSKNDFEDFAARFGVRIKNIRADNGVYTAKTIQTSCLKNQQNLSFCAVGAHWQNGIAERFIGTIVQQARTLLLHAMSKWPDTITEDFWPFALRYMVMFHNSSIRRNKTLSPFELFTGQQPTWSLSDFRVFGSPAYILHKRLQDGDHFGKWQARSWRGVYVGPSAQHASNVPLIYNPSTTHVTPQFHVVHDEGFTSLTHLPNADHEHMMDQLFQKAVWMHPGKGDSDSEFHYFDSFWDDPPDLQSAPSTKKKRSHDEICSSSDHTLPPVSGASIPVDSTPSGPTDVNFSNTSPVSGYEGDQIQSVSEGALDQQNGTYTSPIYNSLPVSGHEGYSASVSDSTTNATPLNQAVSAFLSKPKIQYCIYKGSLSFQQTQAALGLACNVYHAHPNNIKDSSRCESQPNPIPTAPHVFSTYIDLPVVYTESSLSAYLALNNKEDTLTQSQMLRTQDMEKFISSQIPEIRGLEAMGVFAYKTIETLPPRARLLSSIWSYRRKRKPNGELLKHKARICVDGSQQALGRDYWETYAPVVSWSTVRLVLLLSTLLNLKSRQVDYTQAFPQADLADPVYIRLPQGWYITPSGTLEPHSNPKFNDTTHYIQLMKNLYGCKQAARNWFQHLDAGLKAHGFKQSHIDPCLYLRKDCIMVVYTDDCLIFAPNDTIIDSLIADLSALYKLEDQGDVHDYLGIRIEKDNTTKTISMTQTGLIESIIQDLNLETSSNTKTTPSDSILHSDSNGEPRQESWHYRSVIGKLNYLAQNSRPDISYAVHQCARFCTRPTALHELAVKRIARYLLLTKDKGLILQPSKNITLDMYVDADFAGMWHQEHSALRENVLSRTGYIITFCDCPIHWASKLQSEIALSTTEAEYIALSMATRELLPLRRIVQEIHQYSLVHLPLPATFNTTKSSTLQATQVYEDNASCIVLAHSEGSKQRTKHISIKWHHFRDQIRNGNIKIVKIDTHSNWADILTKPLGPQKFQTLRKLIMHW